MVGSRGERGEGNEQAEGTVSLMAEVPESLLTSMRSFIDHHPNWDQYRLFQAALAGFLVQHGCQDRAVTRCYLANLFPGQGRFHGTVSDSPRQNGSRLRHPHGEPNHRRDDRTDLRAA
ncbi:MAG: DUF2811 domain-containing protein [Cyanobacteriota bacterium]|nr:DUF2811 domain-containing protein [Cyanobacteriota bacterium]